MKYYNLTTIHTLLLTHHHLIGPILFKVLVCFYWN